MLTPRIILWAMLVPAAIAIVAIVGSHVGFRRDRRVQPWGPALAIGGAFAGAYFGVVAQRPAWPASTAQGWLFYLAALPVIVGVVATTVRPLWVQWVLCGIVLVSAAYLLTRPRAAALEPGALNRTLGMAVALMVLWWVAMEDLACRQRGGVFPLLLSVAVGSGAIALVAAHSLALGQILGGVVIAVLVVAVAGFWYREMTLARGGMLAIALTFLGLLLCGHLYADMTPRDALVLAAAPLTLWIGETPALRCGRPWVKFLVCAVVLLGVLAIVLVPALRELKATMDEQTAYES